MFMDFRRLFMTVVMEMAVQLCRFASVCAQNVPEEKIMMTFYALRNMYVDSITISPLVEYQMMMLMQCLDPHSEYLTAEAARANENMLLAPTAMAVAYGMSADGVEKAEMVEKKIGYIRLSIFSQSTPGRFHHVVDSMKHKGMESLVLDIRGNGGGFFDSALELADEFIPAGSLLVTTEGKNSPRQEVRARKKGLLEKGRVVILVDEGTMSAAEIFAGAVQDWDRAVLIGRRTFGKGLIQETLPFSDGSAIRISVARYFTPCGRSVQKPYMNRSREAYFSEVQNRPDDGSLSDEERQKVYESMVNQRALYGGGGITPDILVAKTAPSDDAVKMALDVLKDSKRFKYLLTTGTAQIAEPAFAKSSVMEISGCLPDDSYSGRRIVLEKVDPIYTDSSTVLADCIVKGRSFSFRYDASGAPELGNIRFSEVASNDIFSVFNADVILEPGRMEVMYDSLSYTLSGTPLNEAFNDCILKAERERRARTYAINAERNEAQAGSGLSAEEEQRYNSEITALNIDYMSKFSAFLRNNISRPFASRLLFRYPLDRYPETDRAFLEKNCDQSLLKKRQERDEAVRKKEEYFLESRKLMRVGGHYRDIVGVTPEGHDVKLSEQVKEGRIMLIDFWASWCVPCRQEIPFLKELYAKYHERGLDIVSVSLDKSRQAWLKALEKNDMPWMQMSDLKAWDGPVTQDYGVQAIPFLVLLDKKGNIVVRNLHDKLLEDAIRKALDN